MNNKLLLALIVGLAIMTTYASAGEHLVPITLDKKQEEGLQNKMNETGKNASLTIEADVQNIYSGGYDKELEEQFANLAEEIISMHDYEKTKLGIEALKKIVDGE